MKSEPAIELSQVCAGYGGIQVLNGIDLRVEAGTMFAVLGPNGAGKTTLLKVIVGLLEATAGEVQLGGESIRGLGSPLLARAGVRLVPEVGAVFPNLTVRENLGVAVRDRRRRASAEDRSYARFPVLASRRDQLAGTLSGGEQQMLAVARALSGDPKVLLLDELSTGLAPLIVAELLEHVRALSEDGVTVVVVEQFARAVLPIVDLAGLLLKGELHVARPADIDRQLQKAYLGDDRRPLAPA